MGLDPVELILEVERGFDVRLPDDKYGDIRTVGDLYDYLDGIKHFAKDGRCASIDAFFKTRLAITTLFAIPREQIRPKTPLSSLIPVANRRLDWRRLADSLNVELPPLALPSWVTLLLIMLGTIVVLSSLALISSPLTILVYLTVAIGSVWFLMALHSVLAFRFAMEIPGRCQLVRDAAYSSLVSNQRTSNGTTCGLTRAEAWRLLQRIICEQLGVSPSEVHRNASFVDDLGLN